jgi:isochorismate hydrolase
MKPKLENTCSSSNTSRYAMSEKTTYGRFAHRTVERGYIPSMTSLQDRPNTALMVIDMQRGVVGEAFEVERVIDNINTLVERARAADAPVIWVQHSDEDLVEGSDSWQYVDELRRADDEALVHKHYGDSFAETDLESILADSHVGHLVVTGAQTDACIRSTLHGALVRGYDATLVSDAHTTEDMREWGGPIGAADAIAYTNLYWRFSDAPGCSGNTSPTADITFTRPAMSEPPE